MESAASGGMRIVWFGGGHMWRSNTGITCPQREESRWEPDTRGEDVVGMFHSVTGCNYEFTYTSTQK